MNKRLFLAATVSAAILGSYAQINSPTAQGYLSRALMMYNDGNYFGCIDQLTGINESLLTPEETEELHLYRALATVHTDKLLAIDMLERFIAAYPESMHYNEALLALGDCYFGSDYKNALDIYDSIYISSLNEAQNESLLYHTAGCLLSLGRLDEALPIYESLINSPRYGNDSKFYWAYIEYTRKDYARAEAMFRRVDTSRPPGNMASFYLSQIYYMNKDYAQALTVAKRLAESTSIDPQYIAEANRIAGEAAYRLGDNVQSVKYLKRYVSMVESPLPSALYILGMDAYMLHQYDEAIDYLNGATGDDDAMSQSAYLYIGQSYMHLGDYSAAAMALNRALNMDYDSDVRQMAYYNYAVASINGGKVPFASTVKVLSDFLRLYPNSEYAPAVQRYIISSYLTDNNYAAALQSINSMTSPSAETLAAKQRILYTISNKSLAQGEYDEAITYLEEAKGLSKYDPAVALETLLALGEAYYQTGDYTKSVSLIKQYISKAKNDNVNLSLAHYDLGYALYAQKRYADALQQFLLSVKSGSNLNNVVRADACNRIGDCYYYAKDFDKAISAYDEAYTYNPTAGDYSLLQKALMAGYQRNYEKKIAVINTLQREFPSSALIPTAMLELTESYIQLGNNAKAIDVYTDLVDRYPNTVQGRQGYLQMAIVKLNSGDRGGAVHDYKEVIRRYPSSDEALLAIEQMKRIAAEDGTLSEFNAFLATVDNAPQINADEMDSLSFEAAERDYLTDGSSARLEQYVVSYPQGAQRAKALSYLIDIYYRNDDDDKAYRYAETLISEYPSSAYVQTALSIKAQVEEDTGRHNLALRTWRQLADMASSPAVLLEARMGIIYNGIKGTQYDDVLTAAEAVMSTSGVDAGDMANAKWAAATALANKGERERAHELWEDASSNTDLMYGIMSAYSLAEDHYNAKDYKNAEKWAKNVVNSDSPNQYWIARGFILLSDIYRATGDTYKAKQYIEALRDNYGGDEDDIKMMIDQRLK